MRLTQHLIRIQPCFKTPCLTPPVAIFQVKQRGSLPCQVFCEEEEGSKPPLKLQQTTCTFPSTLVERQFKAYTEIFHFFNGEIRVLLRVNVSEVKHNSLSTPQKKYLSNSFQLRLCEIILVQLATSIFLYIKTNCY